MATKTFKLYACFFSRRCKIGNLALSAPLPLIQFLGSSHLSIENKKWVNEEMAKKVTKELLDSPEQIFLKEDYPFFRKFSVKKEKKKNLIILVMESWGAKNINVLTGDNPNFNT